MWIPVFRGTLLQNSLSKFTISEWKRSSWSVASGGASGLGLIGNCEEHLGSKGRTLWGLLTRVGGQPAWSPGLPTLVCLCLLVLPHSPWWPEFATQRWLSLSTPWASCLDRASFYRKQAL